MSRFTPGPWLTDESHPGNIYCDDATGSIVATTKGFEYAPRPMPEILANAALIADAPALLDALERLVKDTPAALDYEDAALSEARALIAKHRGGV